MVSFYSLSKLMPANFGVISLFNNRYFALHPVFFRETNSQHDITSFRNPYILNEKNYISFQLILQHIFFSSRYLQRDKNEHNITSFYKTCPLFLSCFLPRENIKQYCSFILCLPIIIISNFFYRGPNLNTISFSNTNLLPSVKEIQTY